MMEHVSATVGIIGSIVTLIATLAGVWINVSKHRKESSNERLELLKQQRAITDTLSKLVEDVEELKIQNSSQQEEIESTRAFTKSHFRMTLFNSLTVALERGNTYVSEATEITKMYSIYKQYGGNGEIELLYNKYDKLSIEEDKYENDK